MQMNVTAPAFTGKTAYTKQGNEYNKTNTFAKVGLGVGLAAAAGVAAYENRAALGKVFTKENGQKTLDSIGKFFKETIPNLFKKAPKVVDEAAAAAEKPAAEAVTDAVTDAAEAAQKQGKIRTFFNSIADNFKNIDMKKVGKATGKAAVIAAPVILLTAAGLVVDKLNNNKKAREADLNA